MTPYVVPLQVGTPQTFSIALGGTTYKLTVLYRNDPQQGWVLDIADSADTPIIQGIPLVTGADLLAQYQHLIPGHLSVVTTQDPDAVPTFDNLGKDALLYWVTLP